MYKFLYNNFKYILLLLLCLIITLFIGLNRSSAAFMDFIDQSWWLDPYQYSEVYSYTGTNNRAFTSTTWGTYQVEVGYAHKFGALVQNPVGISDSNNQDYFLQPSNLYLVTFNVNTGEDNVLRSQSMLLRDYGSYKSINMRLKYLSTNGGYNYVTVSKDNLAYYSVVRFSDYDFKINFLVTLPDAPSDMNSEYMTLDFWVDVPNCTSLPGEGCGITYVQANTSRKVGINLFQMSYATADIINDYLTTINSFNSVSFQSETRTRIDNVLTILQNQEGQLADLNELLNKMENPDLTTLRGATNWLPAGPVDSILVMPLSLINSLTSSLSNNTCSAFNITLPFVNRSISLPCISSIFEQIGLLTFWNWVGVLASAFIVYYYLKNLYKWVDNTLTFRENSQADWGGI